MRFFILDTRTQSSNSLATKVQKPAKKLVYEYINMHKYNIFMSYI